MAMLCVAPACKVLDISRVGVFKSGCAYNIAVMQANVRSRLGCIYDSKAIGEYLSVENNLGMGVQRRERQSQKSEEGKECEGHGFCVTREV